MKKIIVTSLSLLLSASLWAQKMSLNDCIAYAVENNYNVKSKTTDSENAKIDYEMAIMDLLPSVSGSVSPYLSFGRGIDPETNSYINTSTFNNGMSISGSLPIFNGLRLLNQTRSAKISKLRGEDDLQREKDDVAEKTMIAYATVIYNEELVALYEQRISTYKIDLQRLKRLNDLGAGSKSDILQLQATLAAEEYSAISARNSYEISIIELKDCMNYPLNDSLEISGIIENENITTTSVESLVEYALENNIAAQIVAEDLKLSELNLKIARGSYYPTISLSGGLSTSYYKNLTMGTYSLFGEQLKSNLGEWFGASISIPIFNGLSTRKNVRKAKNNLKLAQDTHDNTLRTLESEIRKATMELEVADQQQQQALQTVEYQREANEAAHKRFATGAVSIIELQTSDNDLFKAEAELRHSELSYRIKLREVNYYNGIPYID